MEQTARLRAAFSRALATSICPKCGRRHRPGLNVISNLHPETESRRGVEPLVFQMTRHRVIFHVDMDAFFASIEQRDQPAYRGVPLVVGAPPDRRGVVAAASYEARRFGVRSAMPSRTAFQKCPEAVFVRPRMSVYRAESVKIMEIFQSITPSVERVSVDEAYLDMSEVVPDAENADTALQEALPLANEIRRRIREERCLTASVGVAANKFLAKLGSDFQKPDGLTLISEAGKIEFLRPLSVRLIHGVGPVTAQALEDAGLRTIGDLQVTKLPLETLVGSFALRLRERAFGIDERPLDLSRERKSISAEHTFSSDTEHRPELRRALRELATEVAESLSRHEVAALTVQIKVRYSDFTTLTRQIRMQEPVRTESDLYRVACFLMANHKLVIGPLRLVGIGVSNFSPPVQAQLSLPL